MSEPLALIWPVADLRATLAAALPGATVEVCARIDSTNTELMRRARAGAAMPVLLVAEQQSAGRGRLGRPWQGGAPGATLSFSLGLPLAPRDWSGLSLAVGLAVAEALHPAIGLKWPNDLWLLDAPGQGRKLGGVLIETVAVGERRMAVIGVGLNVRPPMPAQLPAQELASGYACAQELRPGINPPEALRCVAAPLAGALKRFERDGLAPFVDAYRRRDLLLGQSVRTTDADAPEGIAEGIDAQGALLVRARGGVFTLVGGEVSVRPAGA